jgi:hypothetical protein
MSLGTKPLLLIVDPEPYSRAIAEMVFGAKYEIRRVTSITRAIHDVSHNPPMAILSEMLLEDGNAEALRHRLEGEPLTRGIPFVVMTNLLAAKEHSSGLIHINKGDLGQYFESALIQALNARIDLGRSLPDSKFRPISDSITASFLFEPGRDVLIQYHQNGFHVERTEQPPWAACYNCAELLASADTSIRAADLDRCGQMMYSLLRECCALDAIRGIAKGMGDEVTLRFQFIGGTELLQIPFETLVNLEDRKPLAIQHVVDRAFVRSGRVNRAGDSRFLRRKTKLRSLIIGFAEDLERDTYKVAAELERILNCMEALRDKAVEPICEVIWPSQVSLEEIERLMLAEVWDIVHIVGHCPKPKSKSFVDGIPFRSHSTGRMERLSPGFLGALIEQSSRAGWPPELVFMSCCYGSEVYGKTLLGAGVPALVTFRGWHHPAHFVMFVNLFYQYLCEYGDLQTAMHLARFDVYESFHSSGIWAAASMVL